MFAERAFQKPDGELIRFEKVPNVDELAQAGASVINTEEPQFIADGAFYLSGEIPRHTAYETGLPGHVRRASDGQGWEPDPLILDERFISVHVKDKGQVVFTACSHAGVVNVLTHARACVSGSRTLWRCRRSASVGRNGKDHATDRRRFAGVRSTAYRTWSLHWLASFECYVEQSLVMSWFR